jgi:CHAD domain-containing protein
VKICLDPLPKASKGLRQGVKKCIRSAVSARAVSGDAGRIHCLRVTVKRLRSYLRLLRPHLKPSFYRRENRRLRDAARSLSELRDAQVAGALLKELSARETKKNGHTHLAGVARILAAHRPAASPPRGKKDPTAPVAQALEDFARRFHRLDFGKTGGWKLLQPGLARSFCETQAAYHEARDTRQPEAFHEWRKRLKYLRFQAELLLKTKSTVVPGFYRALYDMELALGHHHDLFLLVQQIAHLKPGRRLTPETRDQAALFLAACVQDTETGILDMGRRVFVSEGFDLIKVLDQELG